MAGRITAEDADPYRVHWWLTMGLGAFIGATVGHPLAGGLIGLVVLLTAMTLVAVGRTVRRRVTDAMDDRVRRLVVEEMDRRAVSTEE